MVGMSLWDAGGCSCCHASAGMQMAIVVLAVVGQDDGGCGRGVVQSVKTLMSQWYIMSDEVDLPGVQICHTRHKKLAGAARGAKGGGKPLECCHDSSEREPGSQVSMSH